MQAPWPEPPSVDSPPARVYPDFRICTPGNGPTVCTPRRSPFPVRSASGLHFPTGNGDLERSPPPETPARGDACGRRVTQGRLPSHGLPGVQARALRADRRPRVQGGGDSGVEEAEAFEEASGEQRGPGDSRRQAGAVAKARRTERA